LSIAEKIAKTLHFDHYDNVLEIGPGMGVLTQFLPWKEGKVSLIELDSESIEYLQANYVSMIDKIHEGDFLKIDLSTLMGKAPFAIIGNFPYNISSQIVFKIIDYRKYIPEMCGMFQYEVAERICEHEGSKKYGIISVITQAYCKTSLLFEVSNNLFTPPPKVNSAVISLKRKKNINLNCDEKLFLKIVKLSFQQRRKTIRNDLKQINLSDNLREDIIFDKRPEQLSVNEFIDLTNLVSHDLNN